MDIFGLEFNFCFHIVLNLIFQYLYAVVKLNNGGKDIQNILNMQEKNKKNTEISARILQIIENQGITPNLFAKKLGYERSQTVYDVINGKSAPSYDFFRRFELSEYSEGINISWLLTGNGQMLRKTKCTENEMLPVAVNILPAASESKYTDNTNTNQENREKIYDKLLDRIERMSGEITLLRKENEELKNNRFQPVGIASYRHEPQTVNA